MSTRSSLSSSSSSSSSKLNKNQYDSPSYSHTEALYDPSAFINPNVNSDMNLFNNALKQYYELKAQYESSFQKSKDPETNMVTITKKCIGGCGYKFKYTPQQGKNLEATLFKVHHKTGENEIIQGYRELTAECQNPNKKRQQRCIHVSLNLGRYALLPDILKQQENIIREKQIEENSLKCEHKCGLKTDEEIVKSHDTAMIDIQNSKDALNDYKEMYKEILKVKKEKEERDHILEDGTKKALNEMKKQLTNYYASSNTEDKEVSLKDVMTLYRDEVYDIKRRIMNDKEAMWVNNLLYPLDEKDKQMLHPIHIPMEQLDRPYMTPPSLLGEQRWRYIPQQQSTSKSKVKSKPIQGKTKKRQSMLDYNQSVKKKNKTKNTRRESMYIENASDDENNDDNDNNNNNNNNDDNDDNSAEGMRIGGSMNKRLVKSYDPYIILGISRNATNTEIKEAYKKKAALYHPTHSNHGIPNHDNNKNDTKVMFKQVSDSYQNLIDPDRRKYYDEHNVFLDTGDLIDPYFLYNMFVH